MLLQITFISFLQNMSRYFPSEVSIFFAKYLAWVFCGLLIMFIMKELVVHLFKREDRHVRKILFSIGISAIISFFTQWLAKLLIYSGRPFTTGVYSYYQYGGHDSFPSGHALVFMALAVTVFKFHKYWGVMFIIMAIIIGIFRIIVGIHWPVDILIGWLLGVIIGILSAHFIKKTIS